MPRSNGSSIKHADSATKLASSGPSYSIVPGSTSSRPVQTPEDPHSQSAAGSSKWSSCGGCGLSLTQEVLGLRIRKKARDSSPNGRETVTERNGGVRCCRWVGIRPPEAATWPEKSRSYGLRNPGEDRSLGNLLATKGRAFAAIGDP
jgi:hypothetical protein